MQRSIRYALSISLALSLFSGCVPQLRVEKVISTDNTLPIPSLSGSLSDITSTAFEWKPAEDSRVSGYNVYRSTPGAEDKKLLRIATVESRFSTHFVDKDLLPNSEYFYRFSSATKGDTESEGSETMGVITLPMITPVSFFQSVGNMPRSAKLLWRPHPNIRINSYIIDRLNVNDQKWNKITTVLGRLNAEFIDLDLENGQVYDYRISAVTFDGLVTAASETTKVVTKPLPQEIKNITTTNSLPKAITITWEASSLKDLSHYSVYRASRSDGHFDYRVKLMATQFTDITKEDGQDFFYKITAVDKDGLESPSGAIATQGYSLSKPLTPTINDGKIALNGVNLLWSNNDPRIISYIVIKTTKKTWASREILEIVNITETKLHDSDILPNIGYAYEVIGIDKDGIRSLPSQAIELNFEQK